MLLVRVRGWHLDEKHIICDGLPLAGALVDFGLYFYHNVFVRLANGTAPYFYLPKMESRFECRLWNEVFQFSEDYLKVKRGEALLVIRPPVYFSAAYSGFQSRFPGTSGLRQYSPGVPPEDIKVLRSTVYFNSPVQICEQGFLKPLEYILGVPSPPKRLKATDNIVQGC